MKLRVKSQNTAAEQSVEQFFTPGADAERFRVRPRNVPEGDDGCVRQQLAHVAREQREMIVLHEHDRIVGVRFLNDCRREFPIHCDVLIPVRGAKRRTHMRVVAERPEPLVREAVVVARFLRRREPEAPDLIRGVVDRHGDSIVAVHHFAIGGAGAMRDPGAGAGTHDRFERRHESTRGLLHDNIAALKHVQIRLAV